jgi:uncharacterized protein (TIRG00374 family)
MTAAEDASARPRRSTARLALRLLGPILLVVVIARLGDLDTMVATLTHASPGWFVLAVLLNPLIVHIKVERWRYLMRHLGYEYGLRRAYAAFLGSAYIGMQTPGRVGDLLRIQYVRHDIEMPYSTGLATVVMDRLSDVYALLGFVAVGVAYFAGALSRDLATIAWIGVGVTALAPLTLFIPGVAEKTLAHAYKRFVRTEQAGGLENFLHALRRYVGRPLVVVLTLAVTPFLLNYTQGWLLARSMGLDITFFQVMCMLSVASLLGLMPVSVAGIGVREAFLALVFPTLGLLSAQGVAFGMSILFVQYVVIMMAGFIAWQLSPPPTKSTRQTEDDPEDVEDRDAA